MDQIDGEKAFGRVQKNPFFRLIAMDRTGRRCTQCGRALTEQDSASHVHHKTYRHCCIYPELIEIQIAKSSENGPSHATIRVPPCETCYANTPPAFEACQTRIALLCEGCHYREHRDDIAEQQKLVDAGHLLRSDFIRERVSERYEARQLASGSQREVVTVNEANLRNNHLYLREIIGFFPPDAVGGASRDSAASRTVRVYYDDRFVDTDIAGDKMIFRKRSWLGKFFERHKLQPGDEVAIIQIDAYTFRIEPLRGRMAAASAVAPTPHR